MKPVALILLLWTLPSLYLGLSGLCAAYVDEEIAKLDPKMEELKKTPMNRTIDDLPPFTNAYDYQYYMTARPYMQVFPLMAAIPSFLGLVLTSMAFGVIGAVTRIVLGIIKGEYPAPENIHYISQPFLGLFIGLCVLGIAYLIPSLLTFNTGSIRPITLMFFSLFCGIYSDQFFQKLSETFIKLFKTDKK